MLTPKKMRGLSEMHSHSWRTQLALALISEGDSIHCSMGLFQPLFGYGTSLLLITITDKSCSEDLKAVYGSLNTQALKENSNEGAGSASSVGSACRFTT